MDGLTVSQLAGMVGTSSDTLRYYERIGLLPEPHRSAAGYRLYDDEAAERVRFIKRAQRFGLRLDDITELLAARDRGLCPCGGTRRLLEARIAELDREMASLNRLRRDIRSMIDAGTPAEGASAEAVNQAGAGADCGPLCLTNGSDTEGPVPANAPSRTFDGKRTRSISIVTETTCGCGSGTGTATTTSAAEPCSCGCCAAPTTTNEQRISELRQLRASLDQELAELDRL